jgi:protein-S-isoprenylcysteine O-methyltransferase Ste14
MRPSSADPGGNAEPGGSDAVEPGRQDRRRQRDCQGGWPPTRIDRAERVAHRLGALVALASVSTLLPGLISAVRERGAASGRPELVFTPLRLLLVGAGWFGGAAAAWRPLPLRPGRASRYALLLGGLIVYLVGMALAVAGRVALGSSYRPSSSVGATLAPDHRLVTSGPFAVVRHPMYLGLALAAIGALAVYRTWSTVLFVVQLPVLVARARREEELLARTFGEAWRRYAARVPAWLPRTRPIAVSRALAGERPVSAFVPGAAAGTLRHPQAVAPEAT